VEPAKQDHPYGCNSLSGGYSFFIRALPGGQYQNLKIFDTGPCFQRQKKEKALDEGTREKYLAARKWNPVFCGEAWREAGCPVSGHEDLGGSGTKGP